MTGSSSIGNNKAKTKSNNGFNAKIAIKKTIALSSESMNLYNNGEMTDEIPTDEQIAASVAKLPKVE